MDRLVSGGWLEDQLGSPDLRVLDCRVGFEVRTEGGVAYRSGRAEREGGGHIPGSAHSRPPVTRADIAMLQGHSSSSWPTSCAMPAARAVTRASATTSRARSTSPGAKRRRSIPA